MHGFMWLHSAGEKNSLNTSKIMIHYKETTNKGSSHTEHGQSYEKKIIIKQHSSRKRGNKLQC